MLPHGVGSFVNSPKNWWGQSPIWLGGSTEPRGSVYHESVSKMAFLGILGLLALLSDDQFMMRTSKLLTNGKCDLGLSPPDLARNSESITVLNSNVVAYQWASTSPMMFTACSTSNISWARLQVQQH